jgi:hypothetical protein
VHRELQDRKVSQVLEVPRVYKASRAKPVPWAQKASPVRGALSVLKVSQD